jgi:hypothetical protein
MTISVAPPPHRPTAPSPHHLLCKNYDCNTSSAAIALTATSPVTIHPLGLVRFAVFLEIWHHFHYGIFLHGVHDDKTKGGGGGCAGTAAIAFMPISPVTFHIKRKVRIHFFDDFQISHLSHIFFKIKFLSPLIPSSTMLIRVHLQKINNKPQ